ncbi:Polymerase/histidinol phosphatase-like protein [Phycomyces nitens]|nr:Polymerase/histidinol phosphatase-like protein [Phycomyces nitens]
MPFSYHSHSGQFCHHGYGMLEDVVKQAIRKGFKVYGLSEHMPRFDSNHLYPEEIEANCTTSTLSTTYAAFLVEARRLQEVYKDQIELLIGAEIEFIDPSYADHVRDLQEEHKIDYVVGSLHHTHTIPIDFSNELYQHALEQIGNGSLEGLFQAYFDEQYQMLSSVKPKVVGHFDLIRIYADQSKAFAALNQPNIWKSVVRNVDYVVSYGGLFEINSRAWKKGLLDAYPQREIIKLIQSKGGKFTLSDDCHGPNDVGMFYDKLHQYLQDTGIETIHYLTKRDGKVIVEEERDIATHPFWTKIKNW